MARLQAIEKALYYPLQPHIIETFVAQHLRATIPYGSHGVFPILDPCAGEGIAVHTLAHALAKATLFRPPDYPWQHASDAHWREHIHVKAVELDHERAAAARDLLGPQNVLNCPAEYIRLVEEANAAFGLIYLNPPYDQNARGRQELDWITMTASLLANDGYMLLVLPDMFVGMDYTKDQGRYAPAFRATMAKAGLFAHLTLRLPRPEYDAFHQVLVWAQKRSNNPAPDSFIHGVVGQCDRTTLWTPVLARFTPTLTHLTPEAAGKPSIFEDTDTPDLLIDLVGNPNPHLARMIPLMPMRVEHAGMVAAAGMFNGAVIDGKVLKGSTVKKEVTVVDEYETAGGSICTEETIAEVHAAQLTILDMDTGQVEMINSHDHAARFEEVLVSNAQRFVDLALQLYPARFDPAADFARYRDALARVCAPRRIDGQPDELFEPQAVRAAAILHYWRAGRVATLVGEMGCGKTAISLAACAVKATQRQDHNQKVVVLLPPKDDLVKKWGEEIMTSLREFKPAVFAVNTIGDVQEAFRTPGLVFILLKETTAKISSGWTPVQPRMRRFSKRTEHCKATCPACGAALTLAPHVELRNTDDPDPGKIKTFCAACDSPMWTVARRKNGNSNGPGYARYPLAKYIRDHCGDRYLLIIDESHAYKSGDSARGYAAQDLLASCHRAIQMTGTIYNGMASSIYYLLWRALPEFRRAWGHNDVQRFINQFGLFETVRKTYRNPKGTTVSGYSEFEERKSERPGVAPGMIAQLLPSTVFIGLRDLGLALPPYEEHTLFVPKPQEFAPVEGYLNMIRSLAIARMQDGEYSLLAQFTWAKQGVWDIASVGDTIEHYPLKPITPPTAGMWSKEEALLRLIAQNKRSGRPVLCYVAQINRRDPTPRLCWLLEQYGMKGAVMRADVTKRLQFIRGALRDGADVIFTSAPLVKEGIDILECPTIAWYGTEYDTYLIPQANARPRRIGQTRDVHVYYLAYNETPQAEAMHHVARKLGAAQTLQGDIRSGLAELLGEPDFVSRLQAATVATEHFESSLTLDDLPPLTVFAPMARLEPPRPVRTQTAHIVAIEIDPRIYQQLSLF
jgi:hypothetical protein